MSSISERVNELLSQKKLTETRAQQYTVQTRLRENDANRIDGEKYRQYAIALHNVLQRSEADKIFAELNNDFFNNKGKVLWGQGTPWCLKSYENGSRTGEGWGGMDGWSLRPLHPHTQAWCGLEWTFEKNDVSTTRLLGICLGFTYPSGLVVRLDTQTWYSSKYEGFIPNNGWTNECLNEFKHDGKKTWTIDNSKMSIDDTLKNGRLSLKEFLTEPLAHLFVSLL